MNPKTGTAQRLPCLDNLRSLMVILVLIFHSGASYSSAVDFWPFHDVSPNGLIDIFMLMGDVFLMSIMFFIAGYFAFPSIIKRGSGRFITGKLKLLGIPWLAVTIGVMPLLDYIHFAVKNGEAIKYGEYWLASMRKIFEFHSGWLDMDAYRPMTEHFYQRYVWFISLLLLFFIIFAALYKTGAIKNIAGKRGIPDWLALTIGGSIAIAPFAVVKLIAYEDILSQGWFSLGNVFQFQLGKVFVYVVYFTLGLYARSGDWFRGNRNLGKCRVWAIACFSIFGMNMLAFKNLSGVEQPLMIFKIAHVIFYPLWILSFAGLFLSFSFKYWNKATKLNKSVAENSYGMYLAHYIFPFLLPLVFRNLPVPALIKFSMVAAVTIAASYAAARIAGGIRKLLGAPK